MGHRVREFLWLCRSLDPKDIALRVSLIDYNEEGLLDLDQFVADYTGRLNRFDARPGETNH